MNINTREYWDKRFGSGDWESKGGREQTRMFAKTQIPYFDLPQDFAGTLIDFGCGTGDAMPEYRKAYPQARLIGVDISEEAIHKCRVNYGTIADFQQGDHSVVPDADVIVASNVFEHLSDHKLIAQFLLQKCKKLFIIVPYRELIWTDSEHINTYTESSFREIGNYESVVFASPGWSEYGWNLWFHIRLKNLVRPFVGDQAKKRSLQIMYKFSMT